MIGQGAPLSTALGQAGSTFIDDTSQHNGSYGIIYCIAACAFTALVSGNGASGSALMGGSALTGITLAPGMLIYGYFTRITLTSGKVIAYHV